MLELALTTLTARTAVAGLTVMQVVSPTAHYLREHGVDVIMVGLVFAAVYYVRTVTQRADPRDRTYD